MYSFIDKVSPYNENQTKNKPFERPVEISEIINKILQVEFRDPYNINLILEIQRFYLSIDFQVKLTKIKVGEIVPNFNTIVIIVK